MNDENIKRRIQIHQLPPDVRIPQIEDFCPKCGEELLETVFYCTKCGWQYKDDNNIHDSK